MTVSNLTVDVSLVIFLLFFLRMNCSKYKKSLLFVAKQNLGIFFTHFVPFLHYAICDNWITIDVYDSVYCDYNDTFGYCNLAIVKVSIITT